MTERDERDRQYARLEGLAVKVATEFWQAHRDQLRAVSTEIGDVLQDAKTSLLTLLDEGRVDMGRYPQEVASYVCRSVRGILHNTHLGGKEVQTMVRISPEFAETLASEGKIPESSPQIDLDSLLFLEDIDKTICGMVLSGMEFDEACTAAGLIGPDARARVRRRLQRSLRDEGT